MDVSDYVVRFLAVKVWEEGLQGSGEDERSE